MSLKPFPVVYILGLLLGLAAVLTAFVVLALHLLDDIVPRASLRRVRITNSLHSTIAESTSELLLGY